MLYYRTGDIESPVKAVMGRKKACPQCKKEHGPHETCEAIKKWRRRGIAPNDRSNHPPSSKVIKTACDLSNLRLHRMTKPDFRLHRNRLLALRARLQGDTTQMEDNALNKDHSKTTSMPNNMAELGTGNSDQELTLSLLGSEEDTLDQIDGALKRIEDGSFGLCEACSKKIPKPRLEAIPYSALCVRCASQQEEGHEAIKK